MNLKELLTGGGLLVLALTLIQISPIKVNPWSALGKLPKKAVKALGRTMNAEMNAALMGKLEEVEASQKETRAILDEHIRIDDERNADSHRQRILQFNNELLRDIPHTEEDFIEMLAEIDFYEDYCKEHPRYKNNRCVLAIEHIKRVYNERLDKHDFL